MRLRDEAQLQEEGRVQFYELVITVEELCDGGDYQYVATSPDLPTLVVAGDSPEEVLELAPRVAQALIASMAASGDELPASLCRVHELPHSVRVTIAA
ncbi:MAG: type II toxin-antitoxin system HicB family antitoxin [Anaerolineae bacterium]